MADGHPTGEILRAYAAGTASEGMSLLVATHLTFCPACRRAVSALEAVSATLFEAAAPETVRDAAFAAILARLDAVPAPEPEAPVAEGLPRPLARKLGKRLDETRWRFRMPGVAEIPIETAGEERVSLIRVRPGCSVPAHTHTATEATLVLRGTLCDGDRRFVAGDVAVATSADHHHPTAGEDEDCICLTVIDGSVRFTGTLGRALNIFAE
jgi:putative transcriptional regulator